jgi:hypothetical protein
VSSVLVFAGCAGVFALGAVLLTRAEFFLTNRAAELRRSTSWFAQGQAAFTASIFQLWFVRAVAAALIVGSVAVATALAMRDFNLV